MKFSGRVQTGSLTRIRRELERGTERAYPLLRTEFENWGIEWERGMVSRFTGDTGTGTLRSRSGNLRRSLQRRVSGSSLNDLRLRLTADGVNYARLQEYGGDIKPKNAQYLTIPVIDNVLPSGLARFPTAKSLAAEYGSRTFFFRSRAGSLFLGARTGKNKTKVFFVLKKGVRVPARLGFHKTWNDLAPSRQRGLANVARRIGAA